MFIKNEKIRECCLRWGISLGVVAILMCVVWSLSPMTWETNDDQIIMGYLAGFMTGTPETLPCIINFLYAALISGLYKLNPTIPWYTCVFMLLLYLSTATICNCCLKCFEKKKTWFIGLGAFGIVFCAIYIEILVNLQFTTVAAICGAACISILAVHRKEEIWIENIVEILLAVIMMFFSYNIRPEVGYITIVVLVCTLAVKIFMHETKKIFTIGCIIGILLVIFVSMILDQIYEKQNGWQSYAEFNHVCTSYLDYPNLSYVGNEKVYESVGWNENTLRLVGSWCLLDENVNTETFSTINKAYENSKSEDIKEKIIFAIHMISNNRDVIRILVLGIVLLCVQIFIMQRLNKCINVSKSEKTKISKSFAVCLAYMLGTFCFYGYFAYLPRFVPRIVKMVTIIGITPFVMNNLKWINLVLTITDGKLARKTVFRKFFAEITVVCLICASWALKGAQRLHIGESFSYDVRKEIDWYAINNQENLYIYDATISNEFMNPFQVYEDEQPYNLIFWGGWTAKSPLWYKQLRKNGYDEITLENLFDEKVYFIGGKKYADMILLRLKDIAKDASYEPVDEVQGYNVYKFIKK